MAATNYLSAVYDRLWEILEAHAPWTTKVLANNRIKLSDTNPYPLKDAWNDSDFPEATLVYGPLTDSMFTHPGKGGRYAYSTTYNPATGGWTERITQAYQLVIIHVDLRGPASALLKLETLTALRKTTGAPVLAKSYVHGFGPIIANDSIISGRASDVSDAGGTKRLMTVFNIPVLMEFGSASLIT